ncbi:MarR family transcriptional regulator [Mycolicibacterium novocastrense]|uniref:Transcriptional regulator n=1 Tax=Mycolicibacterium novocastrense TaxID=59813 RepID=A0ABQ0KP63_MYCNV|nr:MarR family transcriptional regulator [Mycolicibacterium novocastrense]GAT11109.1 transcriptional regulator [Mycolicibacterium novocastrense]
MLSPLGVSFPQYLCMRLLSQSPGMSNAQLARTINVSPQAMNRVVRELQKRSLVVQATMAPSGRSLPMELSIEGAELLNRTNSGVRAAECRVLAEFAEQDRHELLKLLAMLGQR